MGIDSLLSRLHGVKNTGPGRYVAKCPAHEDRSPSLAIRLLEDGRILVHDFAGCSAVEVCGALGLTLGDLFPAPLTHTHFPKIAAPFSAYEALQCLTQESSLLAVAAGNMVLGVALDEGDMMRIATAAGRIASALEAVHGR